MPCAMGSVSRNIIVVAATAIFLAAATAANPAWSSLSAVQNGRYITLDPTLYLAKPNAQWDAAYQGLFDNLYGQN